MLPRQYCTSMSVLPDDSSPTTIIYDSLVSITSQQSVPRAEMGMKQESKRGTCSQVPSELETSEGDYHGPSCFST